MWKRRGALLGLAVLATSTTSACMGGFLLTRKLYSFNDSLTGSKIVNNLLFWALVFVIPIYGLTLTIDAFILNVIEFWTGRNLLAEAERDVDNDGRERLAYAGFEALAVAEDRVEVRMDGVVVAVVERTASGLVINDARDAGLVTAVDDVEVREVARAMNVA